jgi:hypothetical protein
MTTERLRMWLSAGLLFVGIGIGCGDNGGGGEDEAGDESPVCEPGTTIDCACTDGSTATQTCNAEGSGYDACACENTETGDDQNTGDTDTDDTDTTDATDTDTTDATDTDTTDATDTDTTDTDTTETTETTDGPIGEDPVPEIFHPSDGEMRQINTPIPWIGVANDAEDGALSGMSMVWSSDLDGEFGTGEMFNAPLTTLGVHVISLTATDSDGQQGVVTIQLMLVP